MKVGAPRSFGGQLKALREAAGFTQDELATIASLSVHAVSALERGERRRPHVETIRALSAALDLTGATRDAFLESARSPAQTTAVDELTGASLPVPLTVLLGRDTDVDAAQWLADPAARLITSSDQEESGRHAWRWAYERSRTGGPGSLRAVGRHSGTMRSSSRRSPRPPDLSTSPRVICRARPRRVRESPRCWCSTISSAY